MSVYAQEGGSGGSVYAQPSVGGGSVYAGGPGAAPAKKSGHGGFLGGLENAAHYVAQKSELAGRDLKAFPGGIVDLATPAVHEAKATYFLATGNVKAARREAERAHNQSKTLVKGTAIGTEQTVLHPGRDPFQTALLAGSLLSGGGSLAGRLGAISKAAEEGGTAADLAKAGLRKPAAKPRLIQHGDTQVSLHPSKNPAVRALQGLHDKTVQKALDTNPEGRVAAYGTKRLGGSIAEGARVRARLRDVPANLLEQAAKRLTSHTPRAGSRVQQAALELTSVNTSPEDAARFHLEQAAKGVEPARNQALAKLYQRVAEQGLLTRNDRGDVIVDADKHPKLAATDARLATVQGKGDEILARYGVATPEELATRVNRPAQVRAGASYEKATPGKLGQSPTVDAARRRVMSLQRRFDQLAAGEPSHGYEEIAPVGRQKLPRSVYSGPARPRLERLGGALSVAKDTLEQAEKQAAGRVRQTGFGTARSKLEARLAAHPDKLVREYERKFKNVVSTDHARDLSPEYRASKVSRARLAADVHEPSSKIAKLVYKAKLARRPARDRTVTFTAGGTGAGKTSGLELVGTKNHDIVYDTNMNNVASSVEKIDAALNSGRNVKIIYVYRHPVDALRGALHRAHRTGRTVPLDEHIKTHVGSNAAIHELADRYRKDPRVDIKVVDNSYGKNQARVVSLDQLPKVGHTETSDQVTHAYEQEHAAGRIAPHVHEGTAGARNPGRGLREGAEQGRHAGPPDALARKGRGFISYRTEQPRAPKGSVAASVGPVVGEAKSPISTRGFTGAGIEKGLVPKDITGAAAHHLRQIMRFVNTSEHRAQAIKTGSDIRRSSRDVLVRNPGETADKIPAAVNEILGKSKLTTDDVEGLNAALQAYKENLVPGLRDRFAVDRRVGIGTPAPDGYRWVDRNVLEGLAQPGRGPRGRFGRALDNINSAVTAATVYFKIGHVGTRVFTNAATNIVQGSATPLQIAKSVELWKVLPDETRMRALAAAGQHGFQAMPHEGVSAVSQIASKGANWWAKHADAPFRFNSIAFEARKAGFDTPAKFTGFLHDLENPDGLTAEQAAKVDGVAKRANREGIAYDRLSDAERKYITRAVWFYPWVKGTVSFLGNTLLEHPFKAEAIGQAGAEGRRQQQTELGDLPSYEGGLFQLHGGAKPLVADFSTFSPFATPADVADVIARPSSASGLLNPAATAATNLIFGLNQYGGKSKSPLEDALSSLTAPTPEAQILSSYLQRHQDQSKRMFPKSPALYGTLSPLLRALLGPGTPRTLNPTAAHSARARELSGR